MRPNVFFQVYKVVVWRQYMQQYGFTWVSVSCETAF